MMVCRSFTLSSKAAEVVQLILDNGKLRPPEIISRLAIYDPVKGRSWAGPLSVVILTAPPAPAKYSQALHKLVDGHYLGPSTVLSHLSPRDKRIRYEGEEKAKISGFPTAKELKHARETAEARIKREEEEAEQIGMVCCCAICRWGAQHNAYSFIETESQGPVGPIIQGMSLHYRASKPGYKCERQRKAVEEDEVDVRLSF